MNWLDPVIDGFNTVQEALFEGVVQPLAFHLGAGQFLAQAYEGTGWFLYGVVQVLILLAVVGPLERRFPVEPVVDRRAIRVDVLYTLIHRLGLFKLVMFFSVENLLDQGLGTLRAMGMRTWAVDQIWPGVTDVPLVSFVLYLIVFDAILYAMHRAQHRFEWWWALHSLHHSQRQMTMWTDNRNHLIDDVLRDVIFVTLALLIGVPPGQFVAVVVVGQLSESLSHANLRWWFGPLGERLWVSPRFHRLHHAIGIGHEASGTGTLGGHNFGVLLPWWDMLFGTANFERRFDATGVRDQVEPDANGLVRDYGQGFLAQQREGVRRLWAATRAHKS